MIKLGIKHEPSCITNFGVNIKNRGSLIFHGPLIIGNGCSLVCERDSVLEFGKNCGITGRFNVHCAENIFLGDCVSVSWNVNIFDTDFHQTSNPITKKHNNMTSPIRIGHNSWICQDVTILKRSSIPDYCTVSTKSLVNKPLLADKFCVIGGIPAKVLNDVYILREDINSNLAKNNWFITKGLFPFYE